MTEKSKQLGKESAIPEVYTNEYDHITSTDGLSKRELFAAMAMQGIVSDPVSLYENSGKCTGKMYECAAKEAAMYADALLEELCKTDKT